MKRFVLALIFASSISICVGICLLGAPESTSRTASQREVEGMEGSTLGGDLPEPTDHDMRSAGEEEASSSPMAYALPVGATVEHDFSLELWQRMESEEAQPSTEMTYRFSGTAITEILAGDEDRLIVSLRWRDPVVEAHVGQQKVQSEVLEGMRRSMESGLKLLQGRDGVIESIAFFESCEVEERLFFRTILAATRVIVPEGAEVEGSWTVQEEDADGVLELAYECQGEGAPLAEISKVFISRSLGSPEAGERVEEGEGAASFVDGWLASMEWRTSSSVQIPLAGLNLEGRLHASLGGMSRGVCRPAVFEDLFASLEWSVVGSGHEMAELDSRSRENALRAKVGDATVQDLLHEIAALLDAGLHDSAALFEARNKLAILIELEPAAIGELAELIDANALTEGVFDVVVGSIGLAGTPPAQMLLCELVSDPERGTHARLSATISMFQLGEPLSEVLDTVRFLALGGEMDPELSNTSLLLLGHLGKTAQGAALRGELAGFGEALESVDQRRTWLEALGNLGPHTPHEAALPYLGSADSLLRTSAVSALRGSNAPEALQGIYSIATSDPLPDVRCAAVDVISRRSDDGSFEVVTSVLLNDPNSLVRKTAIVGLAERMDEDPAAMALLQQVAGQDPDPDLAQLAHDLLTGEVEEV